MGADKVYIAEMDKRVRELETGKVKGLTMEELASLKLSAIHLISDRLHF